MRQKQIICTAKAWVGLLWVLCDRVARLLLDPRHFSALRNKLLVSVGRIWAVLGEFWARMQRR